MPALEKLLPLLALLPHAAATSMKIDYLRLTNVRTDPITDPDGLSPHVHSFYGATEAAPGTTYETLRNAAGNTGNVEENKSLYWHPTIYRYVDGQYEIQDTSYFSTYYIWPTGATTAFPDGLKMIGGGAGYEAARQEADCSNPGPCPDGVCDRWNDFFPATSCDELELSMLMPSCWDGVNLDSSDHRSHMAYTKNSEADGECPGTHPVRLPQIAVFTRIAPYHGGIHLFSDGTGYFHADYFSGWEAAQLQKVLDECENDSMQSAPDAWCEDHVTFRDAPKSEDVEDEELREKLVPFQPAPFDATRILSEAVDGVADLPGGLQPVIDPTASTATNTEEHCFADATNTFHVWVDPYASELGSWKFLECGDTPMPILAVEKGVTYTFEQFDASNWYHPLAFGTEPDDDEDDLATYYLNGNQIDEDAYEDAFVVAREAWLDASGQSQDEDEGEGGDEGEDEAEEADEEEADEEEGDEEEDAGEGGDEDADADEDRRTLQAAAGYSVTLTVTDEVGDEGEDADEDRRLQAGGDLFYMCNGVRKSTSASGAQFFTKSFPGDDAAVLARSSGEEPATPRYRAGRVRGVNAP
mmetsp:Transcript_5143/g.14901  ORF Transcript_5143/g.14901 Transcript_5143/m.14901 type:complete len:584 (+) Transcript_5143:156-1907(+)